MSEHKVGISAKQLDSVERELAKRDMAGVQTERILVIYPKNQTVVRPKDDRPSRNKERIPWTGGCQHGVGALSASRNAQAM